MTLPADGAAVERDQEMGDNRPKSVSPMFKIILNSGCAGKEYKKKTWSEDHVWSQIIWPLPHKNYDIV